eukprot:140783-Chlamydomonas_euryale.AAC.1
MAPSVAHAGRAQRPSARHGWPDAARTHECMHTHADVRPPFPEVSPRLRGWFKDLCACFDAAGLLSARSLTLRVNRTGSCSPRPSCMAPTSATPRAQWLSTTS